MYSHKKKKKKNEHTPVCKNEFQESSIVALFQHYQNKSYNGHTPQTRSFLDHNCDKLSRKYHFPRQMFPEN